MNIVDLRNLTILARKGISVMGDSVSAEEAQAAWGAIKSAEDFLNELAAQQKAKEEQVVNENSAENTQSGVHVVEIGSDGNVQK